MSKTRNIEAIYPLSPLQQGLLFHAVNEPDSGSYISQLVCAIEGSLEPRILRRTWQELIARNSVLRTVILWQTTGKLLQAVVREAELPWTFLDLPGLSEPQWRPDWEALLKTERRDFDLASPPLMRLALMRVGPLEYRLAWTHHHLILDGWSGAELMAEAFAIYRALLLDESPRARQRRPYRDYINWLNQQDLSQAETFWRQYLAGFAEPTRLAISRDVPDTAIPHEVAHLRVTLPPDLSAHITDRARRNQLTLNSFVQGAWALSLGLSSGELDVVFGCVTSSRPPELKGVDSMVGMFINTLPVRVRIERGSTAIAWLTALQRVQLEMRRFDYSPLTRVQSWSDVPRNQRLFETAVVVFNYPVDASGFSQDGGFRLREVYAIEKTNFKVFVSVYPSPVISLDLAFYRDLFDQADIQRLLDRFRHFLIELARNPARKLGDIPLLTEAERRRVTLDVNPAETGDHAPCMHPLFERQALDTPAAIALEHTTHALTYAELDRITNRVAHRLRASGIGPEVLAAICLPRSLEMVIAVLAVIKSGGAFLPLDPEYPSQRLEFMLADSQAKLLLTSRALAGHFLPCNSQLVFIEDLIGPGNESPLRPPYPDSLAYVIYTSGSTGKPKGAMISHAALVGTLQEMCQVTGIDSADTVLAITTLSFDIAVLELLVPLIAGARVVVAARGVVGNPERLASMIDEYRATFVQATPVTWRMLINSGWSGRPGLRALSGGEELSTDLASGLLERGCILYNAYGPTETTIYCSAAQISEVGTRLSIGRPLGNAAMYVVNDRLDPVPVGVPGEIVISGTCLGRGYLRRPRTTAERFLPNPFGPPGSRLYRSGDLGAWEVNGTVRFFGRIDRQVKILGYRIELGEIEAVLAKHDSVAACVVTARADGAGGKRLIAHLVPKGNPASPDELRKFLQDRLPSYMVPQYYLQGAALPTTPNLKIDHHALQLPAESRSHSASGEFVAPRTPLECTLAAMWAELLRLDSVGVHDDFFALGGHSLLALELQAKVRKSVEFDRPLPSIFTTNTIAKMADYLSSSQAPNLPVTAANRHLTALRAEGSRPPLYCVHPIGGGISCYRSLANYLGSDQPVYGINGPELGGFEESHQSFKEMARSYVAAVRSFQPLGPYLLCGWSYGAVLSYEMGCQLAAQDQDVALLALLDMGGSAGMKIPVIARDILILALVRELQTASGSTAEPLISREELLALKPEQRLPHALEILRSARLISSSTSLQFLERILSGYRTSQELLTGFTPRRWNRKLTLFRAQETDDELVEMDPALAPSRDPAWGWQEFCSQPVEVHRIPGNHNTILQEPYVGIWAGRFKSCIDAALDKQDQCTLATEAFI
jgi:amino acid adenylation domain-containing protein